MTRLRHPNGAARSSGDQATDVVIGNRSVDPFLTALAERVVVADGAMGTMLQAADLTLDDFEGLEGCNEILNVTRPDVVRAIHHAYFDAGADAVETNTFGANWPNLAEYDIADRIDELALAGDADRPRGRRRVRHRRPAPLRARARSAPAPSCRRWATPRTPRCATPTRSPCSAMLDGGVDAILVETCQDLLQAKAAIIGAYRAMAAVRAPRPRHRHVTVETTGTMLLGSEIGAALTALEPLGIDRIGLNCATGPAEMSEHLRALSRQSRIPIIGHAQRRPARARPERRRVPAAARRAGRRAAPRSSPTTACSSSAAAAAPPPSTSARSPSSRRDLTPAGAQPAARSRASLVLPSVPFRQDAGVLMIGERTNANGSKAFRDAMLAEDHERCVDIARDQTREGAHLHGPLHRLRRPRRRRATWTASPADWPRPRRCRSCSTPPSPR